MKIALAFTLTLLACFGAAAHRGKTPEGIQDEPLLQRATCFEAPASISSAWNKFTQSVSDCNPATALSRATTIAYDEVFDAIDSRCPDKISRAEADAFCRAQGNYVLAEETSTVVRTVPRPGGSNNIDRTWGISQTSLCVTFREYAPETSTVGDIGCVLNWGKKTRVRLQVLARCGVKCMPLN